MQRTNISEIQPTLFISQCLSLISLNNPVSFPQSLSLCNFFDFVVFTAFMVFPFYIIRLTFKILVIQPIYVLPLFLIIPSGKTAVLLSHLSPIQKKYGLNLGRSTDYSNCISVIFSVTPSECQNNTLKIAKAISSSILLDLRAQNNPLISLQTMYRIIK
jgi:hypothetical protein